jgi:cell division protein FtsI (penicillin-binding protein 3)
VLVGFLTLSPLGAVLARAAWLQLGHGVQMREMAEDQYLNDLTLTAPRGNIVDRAGRPLAVSVRVPSVFVEPQLVSDVPATARALSRVLETTVRELLPKLQAPRSFAWLARRVSPETGAAVKKLKLPGVGITEETKRFYPNRELAAHVLGYTSIDGQGLDGLELIHNERLKGRTLEVDGFRDARGARLLLSDFAPAELLVGDEVTTTIDAQIQFIAEQAIARAVAAHAALSGFALVMDPRTGAVLALANHPTFNPNDIARAKPDARRNRAVVDSFEPGSTLKAVLFATAYHHGVVRPDELIDCENGVFRVGQHRIRDTHKAGFISAEEVLSHSSNIGALRIGMRLGRQRWGESLRAFGFGKRTDVGLPGEAAGMLASHEKWSDAALATISFGQGISVNGIQLLSAVSALAHGGVLMQPRLVARVRSGDGKGGEEFPPAVLGTVVSPRAAKLTLRGMEKVASADGTAPLAAIPGVRVAGKTGTAQKVDPSTRGYGEGRIASFVGVVPANRPRLVILVVVDEPQDSPYGGVVAAPAFREIAVAALPLMGVGVELADAPDAVQALPVNGAGREPMLRVSEEALERARVLARQLASEDPVDGIDETDADAVPGSRVPVLLGMNARVAIRAALEAGLEPAVEGSGVVVKQRPEPGGPLAGERVVRLTLRPTYEEGP